MAATGIALGFATIVAGGAVLANSGHDSKKWPAVAGVLIEAKRLELRPDRRWGKRG